MSAKHTPGPWDWFMHPGEVPYLATPDRGRLYVMDFSRKGMQRATPRFSVWPGISDGEERGRRGGLMEDGPLLKDGSLHPDARLIAAAPELLEALERIKQVPQDTMSDGKALREIINIASAAIAKAGGAA